MPCHGANFHGLSVKCLHLRFLGKTHLSGPNMCGLRRNLTIFVVLLYREKTLGGNLEFILKKKEKGIFNENQSVAVLLLLCLSSFSEHSGHPKKSIYLFLFFFLNHIKFLWGSENAGNKPLVWPGDDRVEATKKELRVRQEVQTPLGWKAAKGSRAKFATFFQ